MPVLRIEPWFIFIFLCLYPGLQLVAFHFRVVWLCITSNSYLLMAMINNLKTDQVGFLTFSSWFTWFVYTAKLGWAHAKLTWLQTNLSLIRIYNTQFKLIQNNIQCHQDTINKANNIINDTNSINEEENELKGGTDQN